jgi:hypothetical protein
MLVHASHVLLHVALVAQSAVSALLVLYRPAVQLHVFCSLVLAHVDLGIIRLGFLAALPAMTELGTAVPPVALRHHLILVE